MIQSKMEKNFFMLIEKNDKKRKEITLDAPWIPSFVIYFKSFFLSLIKIYLYILFVFFPFGYAVTFVVSGSMTPTCQTNEIVLSSQLCFGLKLSKLFGSDPNIPGILDKILWKYEEPKVGDIVSFQVPSIDEESIFTKRIVATDGDIVQFKQGILFINKKSVKLEFKEKYTFVEDNKYYSGDIYIETLPNGIKHEVLYLYQLGSGNGDNTQEYIVPKGHVFCVGNNRHNSDDSRMLFAFVEKRHILGKVVMVLFSNGNLTSLNISKLIEGMRWDRCLKWMV